ncbi:hypothetical protein J121_415 [Qipengyuania citrea LAMA 915]|uniref:Uncharacterized protein n=2 Tax=Qipengyuania citrea TaxID=225971 RepID=A0A0L1KFF8_9SPHN|nr:hypothetical protein J121_415 [Qipengyuania citrea LAMA 915]
MMMTAYGPFTPENCAVGAMLAGPGPSTISFEDDDALRVP